MSQLDGIFASLEAIDHRRMISLPVHDIAPEISISVLPAGWELFALRIAECYCYSQIHYFTTKEFNKEKNIFEKKIFICHKSFQSNRWYYLAINYSKIFFEYLS